MNEATQEFADLLWAQVNSPQSARRIADSLARELGVDDPRVASRNRFKVAIDETIRQQIDEADDPFTLGVFNAALASAAAQEEIDSRANNRLHLLLDNLWARVNEEFDELIGELYDELPWWLEWIVPEDRIRGALERILTRVLTWAGELVDGDS